MQTTAPPQAPPFCPHADCPFHQGDRTTWRFRRHGSFRSSGRRAQRYLCLSCRRTFSDRTFAASYWLRRPLLLRPIALRLVSCSGFRQIARELEVSPQTVARHAGRLGRQAVLFHESLRQLLPPSEPLALDSFVTFEWSQYFPSQYHFLVGRNSHYVYGFTESEVRRSGRMSPAQKRRRAALEERFGRPDPRAIEKDVARLLTITLPEGRMADLTTDEHQAYPLAIRRLHERRVVHRRVPSTLRRTPANPLFAVNLLDLLIRHSGANQKRETVAYSRRRQNAIERMWLFVAWRNYVKSFSEKVRSDTPAQLAGITTKRWRLKELFRRRLFPKHIGLPGIWQGHFDRRSASRVVAANVHSSLRFAY